MAQNVDIALGHIIDFGLLTTGYGSLKWNPTLCGGKGDMELKAIGPTDLMPIRPQGTDIQSCSGVIYRSIKPLEWFRFKYGDRGWRVQPDPTYSMGNRAASRPPWIMQGVWDLMSPAMRKIVTVRQDLPQSTFPMAEYREFWVKDSSVNTGPTKVYVGEPGKNWSYSVNPGAPLYPRGRLMITGGTDVLLYDGPNPFWHGRYPFEKLCLNPTPWQWHGNCYSSDTEVLTRRGWIKFTEAVPSDEFATRSKEKKFQWQKATRFTNEPYVGPMNKFHSVSVNLLVTPNHRMIVTPVPRAIGGYNNSGPKIANKKRQKHEIVMTAAEVALHWTCNTAVPQTSIWDSGVEVGEQVFPCAGRTAEKPVRMNGDDYCAFMGAYLSEGWTNNRSGTKIVRTVCITQMEKSKGYLPYKTLLERILGGPVQRSKKDFVITRSGLARFCKQFGRSWEKYIPEEIMNAPTRQLKIFWDNFVHGDGSVKERVNKVYKPRAGEENSQRISTVSRRMSDQLVEIAQKLGWSASVAEYPENTIVTKQGKLSHRRRKFELVLRYSKYMRVRSEVEQYDGMVHCVTVPNGTLYVRRNGKPSWCGNSEYKVQLPLQDVVNQVFAGVLDNVKKAVNPVLISAENAFSASVRQTMDPSMPGAKLFYNPNVAQGKPEFANPPNLPGYVMDLMIWAMREMDSASGILDLSQISRMGQIPAADTLEQLKEGQQTVIRLKGRYIEEFLRNVGTQAVSNFLQFYTMERRIRLLGDDGISFQDLDFDPRNMIPSGMDPQLFSQSFAFNIRPDSALASARIQKGMILMQLRARGDCDRKTVLEALGFGSKADQIEANLREEGKDMLIQLVKQKMAQGGGSMGAANLMNGLQSAGGSASAVQ